MNKFAILIFALGLFACQEGKKNKELPLEDNKELQTMYDEDQADRKTDKIDWSVVSKRDTIRHTRVLEMLDSSLVNTGKDYYNAAMIFQHGLDSIASGMAVEMMKKAITLDSTIDKWLLAAAIDRDLMWRKKPQIYGTQYIKNGPDMPWELYKIDTTVISDKERIEYGVETLKQQKLHVEEMNR